MNTFKYEPRPVAIKIPATGHYWSAITQERGRPLRIHDEPFAVKKDATDFSRAYLRRTMRGGTQ